MMEHNLFSSLRKYRRRENHDPLENFITECFAWLLKNNPEYSQFIISKLNDLLALPLGERNSKWLTQANFNGYFPDMVCEFDDSTAIVFENKVWSPLHDNQLNNYRNYAQSKYDKYVLVLITANTSQHLQEPDLAICWKDIYNWSKLKVNIDNKQFCLIRNFLDLLEAEKLGDRPPALKRLSTEILLGLQQQSPEALLLINEMAENGLIGKTITKKHDAEKFEVLYALKKLYYSSEKGLRGEWLGKDRPCLKWENRIRNNEYLNLDNISYLNSNLAILDIA